MANIASEPKFHTALASRYWKDSRDGSNVSKAIAAENYNDRTFSIMLDVKTREDHNTCTPIIIATTEDLDSIHRSIRSIFNIEGTIGLVVSWEASGAPFATVEKDTRLVKSNTLPILRLLQQRAGVDKLSVKSTVRARVV